MGTEGNEFVFVLLKVLLKRLNGADGGIELVLPFFFYLLFFTFKQLVHLRFFLIRLLLGLYDLGFRFDTNLFGLPSCVFDDRAGSLSRQGYFRMDLDQFFRFLLVKLVRWVISFFICLRGFSGVDLSSLFFVDGY